MVAQVRISEKEVVNMPFGGLFSRLTRYCYGWNFATKGLSKASNIF
jgi:hypothetical protein